MKNSSEIFMLLREVQDIADNMEGQTAPEWFWNEVEIIEEEQDLNRENALKYLIISYNSYRDIRGES